jgi:hypothetical protein
MKALTTLLFIGFVGVSGLKAQTESVPRVFVLGQHEKGYEQLTQTYKQSLLEACKNDMEGAFEKWLLMMQAMEAYAEKTAFDIKGVRVLFHVFWNESGGIDYLGYFLRPDSRNLQDQETKELEAFFGAFLRQYTFPVSSNRKYNHYSRAYFPMFTDRAERD